MSTKSTPSPPAEHTDGMSKHEREDSKHGKKREREGSIEPSSNPSNTNSLSSSESNAADRPTTPPSVLPKKKNRLLSSPPTTVLTPSSPAQLDRTEGSKDQEIRKGVEGLGVGEEAAAARKKQEEASSRAMDDSTTSSTETQPESGLVPSTDPDSVKSQAKARLLDDSKTTFSTTATIDSAEDVELSGPPTPQGEGIEDGEMSEEGVAAAVEKGLKRKHVVGGDAATKKVREDEPTDTVSSSSSRPTTTKSSGGFLSFASSSSPFVTSTSAKPSASPFAPTSSLIDLSSQQPTSSKPNILLHSGFAPSSSASPFTMSGSKAKTSSTPFAGSNAFSAFASASPFKSAAAAAGRSNVLDGGGEKKPTASFGDILSNDGGANGNEKGKEGELGGGEEKEEDTFEAAGGNGKIEAQDTVTGEEDEDTKHQVRAKLHVMDSGAWKERGTGLCKLNVHSKTGLARLIMRADGVYRLILNIALFTGMSCEPQDKWVRIVAMENGAVCQLAIKVGTAKAAEDLFDKIQTHIPIDKANSSRSSASKSLVSSTGGWGA